jgi:hypothetical protein
MGVPGDLGSAQGEGLFRKEKDVDELNLKLQAPNCRVSGVWCQGRKKLNPVEDSV